MTRPTTPWTLVKVADEDWLTQNLAALTETYTTLFTEAMTQASNPVWTESNA